MQSKRVNIQKISKYFHSFKGISNHYKMNKLWKGKTCHLCKKRILSFNEYGSCLPVYDDKLEKIRYIYEHWLCNVKRWFSFEGLSGKNSIGSVMLYGSLESFQFPFALNLFKWKSGPYHYIFKYGNAEVYCSRKTWLAFKRKIFKLKKDKWYSIHTLCYKKGLVNFSILNEDIDDLKRGIRIAEQRENYIKKYLRT